MDKDTSSETRATPDQPGRKSFVFKSSRYAPSIYGGIATDRMRLMQRTLPRLSEEQMNRHRQDAFSIEMEEGIIHLGPHPNPLPLHSPSRLTPRRFSPATPSQIPGEHSTSYFPLTLSPTSELGSSNPTPSTSSAPSRKGKQKARSAEPPLSLSHILHSAGTVATHTGGPQIPGVTDSDRQVESSSSASPLRLDAEKLSLDSKGKTKMYSSPPRDPEVSPDTQKSLDPSPNQPSPLSLLPSLEKVGNQPLFNSFFRDVYDVH
ncbi:hypothetical protein DL96DRAFT_1588018 [Flagelloscypha sp. PMI_526]|nr:hypothetical protein DL96DRAFT_1588018 [Flagelloscypha sp. PMI_526]